MQFPAILFICQFGFSRTFLFFVNLAISRTFLFICQFAISRTLCLSVNLIFPHFFSSLVAIVQCETSSGVVNEVEKIAKMVKSTQPKSSVFVDAMSSFGAISLDLENCDWMVSSANKCLQGVPGFAYAICRKSKLQSCKGN